MAVKDGNTMIEVSKGTRTILKGIGGKSQTYDDVIQMMVREQMPKLLDSVTEKEVHAKLCEMMPDEDVPVSELFVDDFDMKLELIKKNSTKKQWGEFWSSVGDSLAYLLDYNAEGLTYVTAQMNCGFLKAKAENDCGLNDMENNPCQWSEDGKCPVDCEIKDKQ